MADLGFQKSDMLEMCAYCFDVLIQNLRGSGTIPDREFLKKEGKFPLFVTWTKRSGIPGSGNQLPKPAWDPSKQSSEQIAEKADLRGCIGTFSPMLLRKGLKDYAITSSLKDRRFHPVTFEEIPSLCVAVSLLTEFEEAGHPKDWEIGKHGIIIDFYEGRQHYNATYLPEVMPEQGWNHDQTLRSLIQKAGYYGSSDVIGSMKVTRYQSKKAAMCYDEYADQYCS